MMNTSAIVHVLIHQHDYDLTFGSVKLGSTHVSIIHAICCAADINRLVLIASFAYFCLHLDLARVHYSIIVFDYSSLCACLLYICCIITGKSMAYLLCIVFTCGR